MASVERRPELKDRIRRAREAAGMTQDELARAVGRDKRTIRNWESGQVPRSAIGAIERVLGVDLSDPDEREQADSPRLDEASDAQVIANLAGRIAARDKRIVELLAEVEQLRAGADPRSGRWAARTREPGDEKDS